jgi:glutamate synthase (NADPH/NADH) small chain
MAMAEAERCLNCKHKPCVSGCPVQVPIPEFIQLVLAGEFEAADAKIKEKNSLPAICGRVCPQETQCEEVCVLAKRGQPIAIGMLERFVADQASLAKKSKNTEGSSPKGEPKYKERIAVIGSGPAGLTCGADLASYGYGVDIFEALHDTGGVLRYGIPEFRLPKSIVDEEVEYVKSLGVNVITNVAVGLTLDLNEMLRSGEYAAAFIATGAGLPYFLNIPGENLNGVYSANEFLTRANLMKAYLFPEYDTPIKVGKRVAVVGAGNVAMDAARTSLRLGAEEVFIVYRRSREEMPARLEEIENAEEEGIQFMLLTNPARILGDDKFRVRAMDCVRMELGEPDSSGRRRPVEIPGSQFTMEVDTVIVAVGQGANPLLTTRVEGLELNKWGNIATVDESGATSIPGVWAGGDIATGASTVISAMGAGKRAAHAIHEWLTSKRDDS